MDLQALTAIAPADGRYRRQTETLSPYFSEFALIKYRVRVEAEYFYALTRAEIPGLARLNAIPHEVFSNIWKTFSLEDAGWIKDKEKETNHDVKAVEYFLKNALTKHPEILLTDAEAEYIHFGLTSQDINNTAIPMMLKEALEAVYTPWLHKVMEQLESKAFAWQSIPMLARTHGQPASPTTVGKELFVFYERLKNEITRLQQLQHSGKFGGATGNFNAHRVAFPNIDWPGFADTFLNDQLGLHRNKTTTQIDHYDGLSALFDSLSRTNNILMDFCKDMWTYVSMDYFKQKTKAGEIGSSAMPHKVNPIDFENAEGNLGLANALFHFISAKLPISRLQRDLTDSTVLRNIGLPVAHSLLALTSIQKGIDKLEINEEKIRKDLDQNWAVLAEAIQTILRREGFPKPYEALKDLTRGNAGINKDSIHAFIHTLPISDALKAELLQLTPENYTGYAKDRSSI
jgi:adenylosuccinate lyase